MYKNRKFRNGTVGATASQKPKKTVNILQPVRENVENELSSPPKSRRIAIQEHVEVHEENYDDLLDSQASIPASQPPTQRRYLSQRSVMLGKTQSRTLSRAPNSFFEMILMKAGADLDQENVIVLSSDNVTFVNRLYNLLQKHQDNPNSIENFLEGLKDYLNEKQMAIKMYSGCSINNPSIDVTVQSQDSIIVNILMIELVQEKVIQILLDQFEKIVENEGNIGAADNISLIPLILSQLKLVTALYPDMLYSRVIKAYEKASPVIQKEIISSSEFVLDPSKHDDFVTYLIENTENNEELLNQTTFHIFSNLYLSPRIQGKIRRRIIQYIKGGCDFSLVPAFIKFLLMATGDGDEILTELVSDLRSCLCSRSDDLKMNNKIQCEIFSYISQALIKSRKMSDIWQKTIQATKENEFKPIDLVILLILISIREEKYYYIENLIRRWIKQERITVHIIIQTKIQLNGVLNEYKDILFRIVHNFLKEKNQFVFNFAKQGYRILFGIGDSYQKKVLLELVELLCDKTITDIKMITLQILKSLNEKYVNELQNCGLLLLPLLDRITEMNLNEFRIVMELLCSISYPQPPLQECQVLKDQIDLIVKKQLISQTFLTKKQGIIGVVQLIYHIVCCEESIEENLYNLDTTINSADDLPDGRGKIAASYIARVFASTCYCIESLALFYDEMAMVFSPKNKRKSNIERYFLVWFCDLITNYFQNYFVIEEIPSEFSNKLSYQNCINTQDDASDSELPSIAINISEPVLKPTSEASASIIVLPPLFNLMHVLHFIRYEGCLDSINAVLGCAIVLPDNLQKFLNNEINEDDLDEDTMKKFIDISFHLINWYRETIGSFISQRNQMIRKKVLLRLNELIKLEENVRHVLSKPFTANYVPPPCKFATSNPTNPILFKKPIGKPKRTATASQQRNKNVTNNREKELETDGMSIIATGRTQNRQKVLTNVNKTHFEGTYGPREKYRQMNFNIMLILKEKLVPKYPLPNENIGNVIGLLEFRFVATDIVNKLESVTGKKKISEEDNSFQHVTYAGDLINDIIHLLPTVMNHFQEFTEIITKTVEAVNSAMGNADLFTDEFNYIKVCHGLCLRLLAAIFSWPEIDDDSNLPLLKNALRVVNNLSIEIDKFTQTEMRGLKDYADRAFSKFIKMDKCIVDLKSAVYLYNLCSSLKKFATNNTNLQKSLSDLCQELLSKKWHNYTGSQDKGANTNLLLDQLLCGVFKNSNFNKLQAVTKILLDEIKYIEKKDGVLKLFPNIQKANFPMVFKHLCTTFIDIINENILKGIMNRLKPWEESCNTLNGLLNIVKSLNAPRNFSLFLKYSHMFIKIFLQHGLPIIETSLRKDPEKANEMLKSLQVTTRFLHNLCCHSKAIKQAAIVAQIPFVRETIENLVFRVKGALAANKCVSVFWMGDLKNKDLHGDIILSQDPSQNDDDDEEDELPEDNYNDGDDDQINVTVHEQSESILAGLSDEPSLSHSSSL